MTNNDDLIEKARKLLKDYGALSPSFLQHKLKINADLARRICDEIVPIEKPTIYK